MSQSLSLQHLKTLEWMTQMFLIILLAITYATFFSACLLLITFI